jgi:hypothetical protein
MIGALRAAETVLFEWPYDLKRAARALAGAVEANCG